MKKAPISMTDCRVYDETIRQEMTPIVSTIEV